MKLSRPSRIVAALLALVSVLFMQFAVASYICPTMKMDGCSGKDMTQPSLCHAHDQAGNQSLDKPVSPPVQPFMPVALVMTVASGEIGHLSQADRPNTFLLARATAPPLAIQHCCFRI